MPSPTSILTTDIGAKVLRTDTELPMRYTGLDAALKGPTLEVDRVGPVGGGVTFKVAKAVDAITPVGTELSMPRHLFTSQYFKLAA
jgi:hypothetical protein